MWWGYSEALDIQSEFDSAKDLKSVKNQEEYNILLIGSGDGRHILKTISKLYLHAPKHINFYVVEPTLELYARQMLLFSIALAPSDDLGLLERTRLFMEIYGNTLVRPKTVSSIKKISSHLIDMVTNLEDAHPMFRVSSLLYKERDALETIFKFWQKPREFHITKLWDARLRTTLGVRYDTREGVFDWDYHMRLRPLGGEKINVYEYKHWRKTGVAFTFLETEYSKGNATLVSGIIRYQDTCLHHGYCGDLTMGPYAAYGMDCEDAEMLKKTQDKYLKRSTDLTERNLMRLFSEIHSQEKYEHKATNFEEENLGVVITEVRDAVETDDEVREKTGDEVSVNLIPTDSVSVTFLPINSLKETERMSTKFSEFFDVISLGHYMVKNLDENIAKMAAKDALVLVEGKKFLIGLRQEEIEESGASFLTKMKEMNFELLKEFNPVEDTVAKFVVKNK